MNKSKILIPLDGSEFSRQILKQITHFFAASQFQLSLLRVAPHPQGLTAHPARLTEIGVPYYESARDAEISQHPVYASQELESLMATVKNELQVEAIFLEEEGYSVTCNVRFGDPASEIVDFANGEDVDVIAMTTHGLSGLSRMIFGSVAEHVVRHANKPVLLLRPAEA